MTTEPTASAAPAGTGRVVGRPFRPEGQSGPEVARLFQRSFALVLGLAWWSLGRQVLVLAGERGLSPAGALFERIARQGDGFLEVPSLFWLGSGDRWLVAGVVVGMLLALLALLGVGTRACFALSAFVYLGYADACGEFLQFQWDNMLVEVAVLGACLSARRPAPFAHFAFRLLLFKLYFESGIAKWQSVLGDWQDGSAMTYYYETAPIPTRLAWYAHHLPERWHHWESWGALVLELVVPWFVWGPRRMRLAVFVALTGFQVVNTLTANYGFFTYLSCVLHVFLLADRDVARVLAALRPGWLGGASSPAAPVRRHGWRAGLALSAAIAGTTAYAVASGIGGLVAFSRSLELRAALGDVHAKFGPFRVANVYHLFGHITRERIEPEFQISSAGAWAAYDLRYKPGDPSRAPPFVAPHQPRVDFRLWFYGLGYRRGMPPYVDALLDRLCFEPRVVQSLFATPLPVAPEAARIVLYRYTFSTRERRAETGAWWRRDVVATTAERRCLR